MTHAEVVAQRIGLALTPEVVKAARYLEQFGLRFCAHFGYANAVEIARQHFASTKCKKRQRVH